MTSKQFAALTPEEVQALTGKDLEAYNKWAVKEAERKAALEEDEEEEEEEEEDDEPAVPAKAGKAKPKLTGRALGKDYFKRHKDCTFDSVVVTSDGEIFPGTPHGKNAADNYRATKKVAGQEIELTEVERD